MEPGTRQATHQAIPVNHDPLHVGLKTVLSSPRCRLRGGALIRRDGQTIKKGSVMAKGSGGGGKGGGGKGQGSGGGWPSTTGNPSGGGRANAPGGGREVRAEVAAV